MYCAEGAGVVIGQNFLPSSSRSSTLSAAMAQAQQMANAQLIGGPQCCQCFAAEFVFPNVCP